MKEELKRTIEIDDRATRLRGRNSPFKISERRKCENENSSFIEFDFQKKHYKVIQETDCSFQKIFYSMTIFEDGKVSRKGIRFLKTVLQAA